MKCHQGKIVFLLLLFFVISLFSYMNAQASNFLLEHQKFFDNKIKVLIPASFFTASDDLIEARFPDEVNRPKVVLTDESEEALISLNIAKNRGDRQTIIHLYRDIKNSIRDGYPNHRFLKTDVIRNRTLAIIEVIMPNQDGVMLYNMMAFKYVGDEFFFFNFSVEESEIEKWRNTAREIAENVREI